MKKQNRIAFFNILSTLLLQVISFISSPIFSRLVGTDGYGVLSVFSTWVSILAIVCSLKTSGTLVNARVEFPEEEQLAYQSSVMFLSLMAFAACGVLMVLFSGPLTRLLDLSGLLLGLMLLQAFGSFCIGFLSNKYVYEFKAGRNMLLSVGVAVSVLLLSVVMVLLLPKEINYYGRIYGNVIIYGGVGIAACAVILFQGKKYYDRKYWRFCLHLALPVVCYNLSDLLLGHFDLVMLRSMLGNSISGIYGYASQFGGIMFMIFEALNTSWVPFFFEDMKHGRLDSLRSQAKNFTELYTVLSLGFILLTREVFSLYAGRDFWGGIPVIPLFVTGFYLNFLCTFPVNFEYYHKKTNVVAVVTISSTLLNLVLNWIFIRSFGMVGAAAATTLSHCFQLFCHFGYARFILGRKDYPIPTGHWLPWLVVYAACLLLVYVTPNAWYLRWTIGAVLGVWELLRIRRRKALF